MARLPVSLNSGVLAWWLCGANALSWLSLAVFGQFGAQPHGSTSEIILLFRFPVELVSLVGVLACSGLLLGVLIVAACFQRLQAKRVLTVIGVTCAVNVLGTVIGVAASFGCQSPQLVDHVVGQEGVHYFFLHSPPPMNGPGHYVVAERRSANGLFYVARTTGCFERGGEFREFVRQTPAMKSAAKELWRRWSTGVQQLP